MRFLFSILFQLYLISSIYAQTCCSGGVPLSSNIGFNSSGQGAFQLAFSFEQNSLRTLYNESNVLELNNRERITLSYLARLGYGITERISVETLIPFINQRRNITQNNGEINNESSAGAGDIVLLAKYDLVKTLAWGLNIGAGLKIPTGSTLETNSIGLLLVNDLQPGSGAIDFLSRISLLHNLDARPSTSIYINTIINIKGTDNDYLGSQRYRFGGEVQVMSGISDQIVWGSKVIYPNLGLRFRSAKRDAINQNELENTGGKWLFVRAGLGMDVYKNHRVSFSYEIPFYTNVDGTQLSPDYIFNITYSTHFLGEGPPTIKLIELQ